VETLRYEALRAAVQDYELINLAEKSLPRQEFEDLAASLYRKILRMESLEQLADTQGVSPDTRYSLDPQDYETAREMLLEAVESA
jgi:hypothetical protein